MAIELISVGAVPIARALDGDGDRPGPGAPGIIGVPRDVSMGDAGGLCGIRAGDALCTFELFGAVRNFPALLFAPGALVATCSFTLLTPSLCEML